MPVITMVTVCKGLWARWTECFDWCELTQWRVLSVIRTHNTRLVRRLIPILLYEWRQLMFIHVSLIPCQLSKHVTVRYHTVQSHVVICVCGSAECCITRRLGLQHARSTAMAKGWPEI